MDVRHDCLIKEDLVLLLELLELGQEHILHFLHLVGELHLHLFHLVESLCADAGLIQPVHFILFRQVKVFGRYHDFLILLFLRDFD